MLTFDRLPVSRVRENRTHGLKGGLDRPSHLTPGDGK
jgi:hypothetical protein